MASSQSSNLTRYSSKPALFPSSSTASRQSSTASGSTSSNKLSVRHLRTSSKANLRPAVAGSPDGSAARRLSTSANGDRPCRSSCSGSALFSIKTWMVLVCKYPEAICKGVYPSLSPRSTSAPDLISLCTRAAFPRAAAKCRALRRSGLRVRESTSPPPSIISLMVASSPFFTAVHQFASKSRSKLSATSRTLSHVSALWSVHSTKYSTDGGTCKSDGGAMVER
mmetsp:Transcript_13031/g.37606  ORF Transcript_13031/g.37606 Transcript_13031/m.37606 type:complete len:224 (+) Transcript_13031:1700-2371(+)